MDWVWFVLLCLMCISGIALAMLKLPGTWIILIAAVVFSWQSGWERPATIILWILLGIAIVAEVVEIAASLVTVRRAGASTRASWGAMIGGFAGMLFLSFPLPIIGTIIGGIVGCFLGAAIAEMTLDRGLQQGARVGFFAAVGQVFGMVAKAGLAMVMAGTAVTAAW